MNTLLKPQEYYYLYSPFGSLPEEMLKYTFQSLILDGHLKFYYRSIFITKNHRDKRSRLFFKLGNNYNPNNNYSQAEQFVLSLFEDRDNELRPYQIKNLVLDKLDQDLRKFRSDYVYKDVRQQGLCVWKMFLTSKGRKARKNYAILIEIFEKDAELLTENESVLKHHLTLLGNGIVFLEDAIVEKLKLTVPDIDEVAAVFEFISGVTYGSGGYYGGSFSGGGSGSSGFGGFGGGMGGGGGSGGSW